LDKLEVKTLPRMMFRTWETMRKGEKLGCGGRVMRCRYVSTEHRVQYQPAPVTGQRIADRRNPRK